MKRITALLSMLLLVMSVTVVADPTPMTDGGGEIALAMDDVMATPADQELAQVGVGGDASSGTVGAGAAAGAGAAGTAAAVGAAAAAAGAIAASAVQSNASGSTHAHLGHVAH